MAKRVGTISFDRADLDLFAAASHDRNPLHLSDAYARRTPYGERVVHGVLGVTAALGSAADRPGLALSSINITFRHPLFVGVNYRVEADNSADTSARFRVFDGRRLIMNAALTYVSALRPRARPTVPGAASRAEAVDLSPDETNVGLGVRGVYAPSSPDLDRLIERWQVSDKGVDDRAWIALLWCSYLIGMELPGRRALFWSADIRIEPRASGPSPPFRYRAQIVRSNAQLEYVDIEAGLSTAERPVATATLRAFVRRESPACDPAALELVLPRSARLSGKLAVVIGGSRGLGAALAQALATQGCTVVASYRESAADAERVKASVNGFPGTVEMIRGDAADEAWCRDVLYPLVTARGGLDFLVCNASPPMRPLNLSLAENERFRRFVSASFDLVSVPVATLIEALSDQSGCCVLISSSFVRSLPADWPHYVAAKSAAEGLIAWAAANFKSVRFVIARPPRLLTDQTNTPAGRQGALKVEQAAAAIVGRICDRSEREPVEILEAF
jgi:NAD(P)-dependent dehydrogenase (short-subunit alcohol dehydrogenase family)/acyl dehydratase